MSMIKLSEFKEALHTRFQVVGAEPLLELVLVRIEENSFHEQFESFSLRFRGPLEPNLLQQTVPFKHETLGECEIYIVPIGTDAKGYSYEAVFNRIRPEEG